MQAWVAVTFAKAEQEWLEAPAALADVVLRSCSCSLWFLAVQAVFSGSGRDQPKKEAKIKVRGSL